MFGLVIKSPHVSKAHGFGYKIESKALHPLKLKNGTILSVTKNHRHWWVG